MVGRRRMRRTRAAPNAALTGLVQYKRVAPAPSLVISVALKSNKLAYGEWQRETKGGGNYTITYG